MALLLDVELALAEGVPELDGAVTRSRNNLPVVGREGDGEDVRGVANEATGGESGVEVPEAEGLVPGGGQSELAVGGDDNVRDEAVVTVEDALGVAVGRLGKGRARGSASEDRPVRPAQRPNVNPDDLHDFWQQFPSA